MERDNCEQWKEAIGEAESWEVSDHCLCLKGASFKLCPSQPALCSFREDWPGDWFFLILPHTECNPAEAGDGSLSLFSFSFNLSLAAIDREGRGAVEKGGKESPSFQKCTCLLSIWGAAGKPNSQPPPHLVILVIRSENFLLKKTSHDSESGGPGTQLWERWKGKELLWVWSVCRGAGSGVGPRSSCTLFSALSKKGHSAFHSIWKCKLLAPFSYVSLWFFQLRERSVTGTLGTSGEYLLKKTIFHKRVSFWTTWLEKRIISEIPNFPLIMLSVQKLIHRLKSGALRR